MNQERLLVWLLRLCGAVEIFAFIAVVMPRSWMEISHAWIGLGAMPEGPVLMFMIRQASYTYVVFNAIAFLVAAPVFFLIDFTSGMPWWWTMSDPVSCGLFGAALLLLSRPLRRLTN